MNVENVELKVDEELLKESDALSTPNTDDIWYDEWVCPECVHGVIIDHPNTTENTDV